MTYEHSAIVPTGFHSVLGLSAAIQIGVIDIPQGNQFTKHQLHVNAIKTETRSSTIIRENIAQEVFQAYPTIFEGIGSFGEPYSIKLAAGHTPVVNPVRKVPFLKKKVMKEELQRTEGLGVISKVEEPTEFVNSLVLTSKSNGELRCCLDPKGLNKAIERERFHIKTRQEICAELSGAKYFSQLDLKSAYWQIQLDVNSNLLTTFGTPFGRYMYNVLPFGLNPASEKRVEKFIIQDQPGALAHQDNILV